VAAVVLWCNLQYCGECVTETTIGSAVVKIVKDEWIEGKGENATVKIVIPDAGLDNGLLPFGTEQLACNLTHCKEHNKNIFKGITLHLLARIIAWSPAPVEIRLI
jgi:hypothetical protein